MLRGSGRARRRPWHGLGRFLQCSRPALQSCGFTALAGVFTAPRSFSVLVGLRSTSTSNILEDDSRNRFSHSALPGSSNKGTGGMECSVVLFKPRIHLFSHALILLSPTRWIIMTGWRTSISPQPFVQTRLDYGSLFYTSISFHPVFQKPCGSNTFELWILVCVHASVSSLSFKHVWMVFPSLSTNIGLQLCQTPVLCSNTFGLWLLV